MISRAKAIVRLMFTISAGMTTKSTFASDTPVTTSTTSIQSKINKNKDPLLLRAARGEKVERTPVWMMRQAGRHMQAYRDLVATYPTFRERSEIPEVSKAISLQPYEAYGVDGVILFSDILTPLPAMGIDFAISEGGKISIEPIRTRQAFSRMKRFEDVKAACPFVGEVLRDLRKEVGNTATVLGFVGLPFTLASYIVEGKTSKEFENLIELSKKDPQLLHDILALLADNISDYACYQIESGAQVIQCFDSWAGQVDDSIYNEFAAQYQRNVIASIKKACPDTPIIIYMAPGIYSSEGKRLSQLAASGADIVSIDHTIEFAKARAITPPGVGIQGNLDPKLLRNGTLDEIRKQTELILSQAARMKHIMNLGHGIEKDTPESHAAFFVKTVQEYQEKNQATS